MDSLETKMQYSWDLLMNSYLHPRIARRPILDERVSTASYTFTTQQVMVNPNYIQLLVNRGVTEDTAIFGILDHEIGHYAVHPRTLASYLVLAEAAHCHYPNDTREVQNSLVNYYSDAAVNLWRMGYKESGNALRQTRAALVGNDDVFDVLTGLYDRQIPFFQTPFFSSQKYLADKEKYDWRIKELQMVDFMNTKQEMFHLYRFGEAIIDLLRKQEQSGTDCNNPFGDCDNEEGNAKSRTAKGQQKIQSKNTTFEDVTGQDLEAALRQIATERPLWQYQRIKKFVESELGKKTSGVQSRQPASSRMIGLEQGDLQWNNELIDYYKKNQKEWECTFIKSQ